MKIKKNIIKFNIKLERLKNPEYIIIHHTENEELDVYKTNEYHKSLGWEGIGYNYFIEKNGHIISGRGMHVGAHTKGLNDKSIGICLSGNFDVGYPTRKQMKSLYKLCRYFMKKYRIKKYNVLGHREVKNVTKSCPGYNFDMDIFRERL